MENSKNITSNNHSITIENNKKATMTGIVEVLSSTDKAVVLKTDKFMFQLIGENLRVSKLVLEEKVCHVEGDIIKLEYNISVRRKHFLSRLFK